MNSLIPNPETEQLRRDCEILGAQLALLFTEHEVLVTDVLPHILADYQVKVGALEFEQFSLQVDIQRLKRKIALIQEALNHGNAPDISAIESRLDSIFKEWQEQIERQLEKLEEAHQRMKQTGDAAHTAEVRKLYRELVLKLHPDITRRTDDCSIAAYRYVVIIRTGINAARNIVGKAANTKLVVRRAVRCN